MGHLAAHSPSVLIFFDYREVDPIVRVDLFDLDMQALFIGADIANRELKITDHRNLRLCGKHDSDVCHR